MIQCDVILSRNKVSFASCSMYRVSSHTGSPCERTAQVPFPTVQNKVSFTVSFVSSFRITIFSDFVVKF